jgi:hypothetical protein
VLARRAKTAQYLAMRAKIVLACADGGTNRQVAARLGVDRTSVDRWRARFVESRRAPSRQRRRPETESTHPARKTGPNSAGS